MSESTGKPAPGTIGWFDLTVEDAPRLRDFYAAVVGWRAASVPMKGYSDFSMHAKGEEGPVAGICHKRGTNALLPSQWLLYIVVEDVQESAARCRELGGSILVEPKGMGEHGSYCVIEDPAGAVAALYEPAGG